MTDDQLADFKEWAEAQIVAAVEELKNHLDMQLLMSEARVTDHVDKRMKLLEHHSNQLANGIGPLTVAIVSQIDTQAALLAKHDEKIMGPEHTAPIGDAS